MQTELQRQHERHKAFHASIASRAAKINPQPEFIRPIVTAMDRIRWRHPSLHIPAREHNVFEERAWQRVICEEELQINVLRPVPNIISIQRVVCNYYGISRDDLIGPSREGWLILPRFVGIYLSRVVAKRSYPYIGQQFGYRDHSSCINAMKKLGRMMRSDLQLAATVEHFVALFTE